MSYVDNYILPIAKKNLAAYKRMSKKAGKIWKEHGALAYKECVAEDIKIKGLGRFDKTLKCKANETVVFAYVLYKSRKHRDLVNAKVMSDPRLHKICNPQNVPFDVKRMVYGGFKAFVDL
ncbi:DUF1428 family protein [bacterium]|nr:DUF1428 family protein [bacterium]